MAGRRRAGEAPREEQEGEPPRAEGRERQQRTGLDPERKALLYKRRLRIKLSAQQSPNGFVKNSNQ